MTGSARSRTGRGRDSEPEIPTPPGLQALLLAALAIGILMLALQLWLLTVSLDLFLAGEGGAVWSIAFVSGLIFSGGLAALRVLSRGPRSVE